MVRLMRFGKGLPLALLLALASPIAMGTGLSGCARGHRDTPKYAYTPDAFTEALETRVPTIPASLSEAPFRIDQETLGRARRLMDSLPRGPDRIQALVDFLSAPEPEGLGLAYDWRATGSASQTLERKRGNCVSLASVLVGIGRGLGWPVYYAEVKSRHPETKDFDEVRTLSDHMAVLITPRSQQMLIDFTGRIEEIHSVRIVDDLTAYAHILNNLSAQHVLTTQARPTPEAWAQALSGFRLASRVQPELGRAWNNMGIALTRLGRFEEARDAYGRAVELDTAFGSAERNLTVMETRASGATAILQKALPQ